MPRSAVSVFIRTLGAAIAVGLLAGGTATALHAQAAGAGGQLPRFASLKSSEVNLRKGPGTDYPTAWVFRRAGLPVEIVAEHEAWRQVRDAEGTTGWVLRTLISARRTAQVLPWDVKENEPRPQVPLAARRSDSADPVAIIEAGVIADVLECDGTWCFVVVDKYRGYIRQAKLWGVYAGEAIE
ncbi:MAG: SH3 domain-containing protein [Hyphomicrobiaceae bacterium]|nr:SH3 domain-containing protein [Hyphomicrobiaceae bacterium]